MRVCQEVTDEIRQPDQGRSHPGAAVGPAGDRSWCYRRRRQGRGG